jgi:hypothetical protein
MLSATLPKPKAIYIGRRSNSTDPSIAYIIVQYFPDKPWTMMVTPYAMALGSSEPPFKIEWTGTTFRCDEKVHQPDYEQGFLSLFSYTEEKRFGDSLKGESLLHTLFMQSHAHAFTEEVIPYTPTSTRIGVFESSTFKCDPPVTQDGSSVLYFEATF